ncbi:hypothetical protein WS94_23360 [Burkholderia territorii]|nr:hypothetical protein WS94_23360 [Burkholderia territorii]
MIRDLIFHINNNPNVPSIFIPCLKNDIGLCIYRLIYIGAMIRSIEQFLHAATIAAFVAIEDRIYNGILLLTCSSQGGKYVILKRLINIHD